MPGANIKHITAFADKTGNAWVAVFVKSPPAPTNQATGAPKDLQYFFKVDTNDKNCPGLLTLRDEALAGQINLWRKRSFMKEIAAADIRASCDEIAENDGDLVAECYIVFPTQEAAGVLVHNKEHQEWVARGWIVD